MATRRRQPWANRYLRFDAWTQDEFRNLVCGLAPHPLDDTPLPVETNVPTRKNVADSFAREELRRVDADRHIQDAILAGSLKVLDPPDERLLAKIASDLSPEEIEGFKRALAHHRTCSKAYRFQRDAAIRWAASRRDLFPDFPFDQSDLYVSRRIEAPDGVVSDELKQHRRSLVQRALRGLGYKTQAAFYRAHSDVTPDILRAVINGDSRRVDLSSRTPKVLTLLGIALADWNAT